jgi:molybdopterin-guanine dinucleotide biosynthesis protein A
LIGLVLCGGQSTRMGRDKGLLINTKKLTWAQQCFSLLARLEVPVAISVNITQLNHYKRIFPMGDLIPDKSDFEIKGPLLGLLSAHCKYPKMDIFVLACDMVEMDLRVLEHLRDYYLQHGGVDAYVFSHDSTIEPLCAIYNSTGLSKIWGLYKQGQLEKFSLKNALQQLTTTYLPVKPEWQHYFSNFNSPNDLKSI